MNSNLGSQQNNILKNGQNTKDDSDITNINQSDLLIFLQFYFINAYKNLSQILFAILSFKRVPIKAREAIITAPKPIPNLLFILFFLLCNCNGSACLFLLDRR